MGANPNFDDIASTTLQLYEDDLADNATRTTVLLDRLRRKGKVKPAPGGRTIVQAIEAALNPNGGWYSGYDTLNITPFEPFTAAEYSWKQAFEPCVWSGLERDIQNTGRAQVIDLVTSRIANSRKSLFDLTAQASFSDGTGFGGKQLHGLGLMVIASPGTGGVVGGIDRNANTFWRNQTQTVDFDAAINIATANPSPFLSAINQLAIKCTRGTDRADLWVADAIGYTRYLESLFDLTAQASFSDGTGFGGKQLHGLGLMVIASPGTGGVVGGIDRNANTFWRNQTQTVDFDAAINIATANPSPFLSAINQLAIKCTRGTDRADLWIADAIGYTRYLESLQPIQRITSDEVAGAGFTALKYFGVGGNADFALDNGYCPAKTVFALNTDYIYLRPHPDRNFTTIGGERMPVNQDATVKFLGFAGNMTASNLSLQGILSDI